MNSNVLHTLASRPPPSLLLPQILLPRRIRFSPINSAGSDDAPPPAPPRITPPETAEIRFRRGSRRRSRLQREKDEGIPKKAEAVEVPKEWKDMSLREKALELYVGEKGLLFWLNKLAYASIFIVIGAWILFRFVGPALNLYQLDSTPLPPSAMFKAS